ncbi:MAG: hypothetical protein VZQ80_07475 [Lachnospiraceae bacterium]|nr:hypothetical protein [Lachnospiraceae bacterium]
MPNEEDYLDGLLHSITNKKSDIEETSAREERERQERIRESNRIGADDDFLQESGLSDFRPERQTHENLRKAFSEAGFLDDFEKELSDGTADDFIRDFESELEEDDGESEKQLSDFLNGDETTAPAMSHTDGMAHENLDAVSSEAEDTNLENFGTDVFSADTGEGASPDDEAVKEDGNAAGTEESAEPDYSAGMNFGDEASDDDDTIIIPEATDQAPDEAVLGNIDEIVKNAKESVTNSSLPTPSGDGGGDDIDLSSILYSGEEENAADKNDTAPAEGEEPDLSAGSEHSVEDDAQAVADLADLFPDGDTSAKEVPLMDDNGDGSDADLMNLLGDDSELSDLGDLLNADENSEALPEAEQEFESSAAAVTTPEPGANDDDVSLSDLEGGEKKGNFLSGLIEKIKGIFAKKTKTDEEAADTDGPVDITPQNPTPSELAAEDASLLAEFGEAPEPAADAGSDEEKDNGKGKKKKKDKKDKKDKKEDDKAKAEAKKAKAEAAAKKKAAKEAAKAKKQAEKEADTSPVVPVKVLAVFVVFAISVVLLYRVFQGAITYRTGLNAALEEYNEGNYIEAYAALANMDLKEDDKVNLDKALVLGLLDTRYRQYAVDMKAKKYEMALSNLIIGTIAYEDNREYAASLGVPDEFDALGTQIEQQLSDQFGLSPDQARELYNIRTRRDFSARIHQILEGLNLLDAGTKASETDSSASDTVSDAEAAEASAETTVEVPTSEAAEGAAADTTTGQ